jgi:hypothetical protein
MMIKQRLIFILLVLIHAPSSSAEGANLDIGFSLGDPTGLVVKKWLSTTQAIDIAAGWSSGKQDKLEIHVDYLIHDFTVVKVKKGALAPYYGIGLRYYERENEKTKTGIRIPVGADYFISRMPLAIFGELVPRLDLSPDTDFSVDGSIGLRYRF